MLVFQFFLSGRKLELEKVILSDFVLREQNARAQCAAPPMELRSKCFAATGWYTFPEKFSNHLWKNCRKRIILYGGGDYFEVQEI